MISKYLLWPLVVVLNLLIFASCLGSSDGDYEYSPNAQIYAFSLTSRADTSSLLSATMFTIDQVQSKIFNKEPLPYLFHVDSALLSITGESTYSPLAQVLLTMGTDSTYSWNGSDSVAINRLRKITTLAPDGETKKEYSFQLNIYQEDPYIIAWEKKANAYLTASPTDQRTVAFNGRFITYYKAGTTVGAMSAPKNVPDGSPMSWTSVNLAGLPATIQMKSLLPTEHAIYALDGNGEVYASNANGTDWSRIVTEHSVEAIYGILPSATDERILLAVDDNGTPRFAVTDDFSELRLMGTIHNNMPLWDFTSTSVENPDSYATRYIVLADGVRKDNTRNDAIWILQEKDGEITYISTPSNVSSIGSQLFYYDKRLYLMIASSGKNSFIYSGNFGLSWVAAEENQAFPSDFTFRTNVSVVADDANNIWIFGGISSTQTQLVDAWRGRLNKFSMN